MDRVDAAISRLKIQPEKELSQMSADIPGQPFIDYKCILAGTTVGSKTLSSSSVPVVIKAFLTLLIRKTPLIN